jgi:transcriptional regulator with XRE-family HTH domain
VTSKRLRFARQRKSCGFTQESFAQALEVDRTTVERWERGEGDPQPCLRPKIAGALGITPVELDALLSPEASGNEDSAHQRELSENGEPMAGVGQNYLDAGGLDEMIRREFLQLASIAGASITPMGSKGDAREDSALADPTDVASLHRMNSHLWQVFSLSSSKGTVYPVVREQLGELTQNLKQVRNPRAQRRLCAAAGDLFQIAGEIFFDSNRYTDATYCYALAASAAKEAVEFDLWACALTRNAFIAINDRKKSRY